jgi:CheY-like chemotaxis protein
LRQVLINLLGNAVKFTDTGSIAIFADTQQQAQTTQLILSVKDTGVGIAADELTHLFQPFEQARVGKSRGGTGLGLLISREYARLMDGDLVASSEPQQGSIFTFTCRVEVESDEQKDTTAKVPSLIGIDLQGVRKTLLVVDDIKEVRHYLAQQLETPGLKIIEAENGLKALEKIEAERPDLVIMDMQMPVMDGYEAIRTLKLKEKNPVPVIAASASAFETDHEEIMATGADVYIRKPFDTQEILKTVAERLGAKRIYQADDSD